MKVTGHFPSVLYFIADSVPTPDEAHDAMRYGPNTMMRNASHMFGITTAGSMENADYYAGKVPALYQKYRPKQCLKSPIKLEKATGNMVTTDDVPAGDGSPPADAGLSGEEAAANIAAKAAEQKRQLAAAGWTKNT